MTIFGACIGRFLMSLGDAIREAGKRCAGVELRLFSKNEREAGNPEASELFWDVVCDRGSILIKCELCGRTHFSTDAIMYEDRDELDSLFAQEADDPDRYVSHANDAHWGYLDGKQAVYECQCNNAGRYEQLIWNDRHLILRYLERRTKENNLKAQVDARKVEQAESAGE